jgi:pimeloyl-ACP methyl ester carboxylesterase
MDSLTICASSMGCHIAVKLLEVLPIRSLVLIAPAIYSKQAFSLPFNNGFTEELRREKSYLENDTMKFFESFYGNLRLVLGAEDTVIPL